MSRLTSRIESLKHRRRRPELSEHDQPRDPALQVQRLERLRDEYVRPTAETEALPRGDEDASWALGSYESGRHRVGWDRSVSGVG
jgi:hypothetical protein